MYTLGMAEWCFPRGSVSLRVYLRLRSGKWMLINSKLEHAATIGKRKVVRYILAGEPVNDPPVLKNAKTVLIPASIVSRIVSRLLDRGQHSTVIIEQHGREHFLVRADGETIKLIEELLQELSSSKKASSTKFETE